MQLTLNLTDGSPRPQAVRIDLDWGKREWTVGPDQQAWRRVGYSNRGLFEAKSWGVLWIWDKPAGGPKTNTVIVHDAPTSPFDFAHKVGNGRLFEPKDPGLKDAEIRWAAVQTAGSKVYPLRQRVIDLCRAKLPPLGQFQEPPNCLEDEGKTHTPGSATGCGGFPGWVIRKLIAGGAKFAPDAVLVKWDENVPVPGQPTPEKGQPYKMMKVPKSDTVRVTSPTTAWETLAKAIEQRRGTPGELFIEYAPGDTNRPKPGDIYLLKQSNGWFRHVGVVMEATYGWLKSADGGQGSGFAVGLRSRAIDVGTGKTSGEDKNPAFLKGWVDLEALVE